MTTVSPRTPESAAEWLIVKLACELSEKCWAAGWMSDTTDAVREVAAGTRTSWGMYTVGHPTVAREWELMRRFVAESGCLPYDWEHVIDSSQESER